MSTTKNNSKKCREVMNDLKGLKDRYEKMIIVLRDKDYKGLVHGTLPTLKRSGKPSLIFDFKVEDDKNDFDYFYIRINDKHCRFDLDLMNTNYTTKLIEYPDMTDYTLKDEDTGIAYELRFL